MVHFGVYFLNLCIATYFNGRSRVLGERMEYGIHRLFWLSENVAAVSEIFCEIFVIIPEHFVVCAISGLL